VDAGTTTVTSGYGDRRARPRTAVAVELKLHAPEQHFVLLSRTVDISPHGAFVRTSRPLPTGASVRVSFQRGESRNTLTIDARVVRSGMADGGRSSGVALQFTDLTDLDETLLSEIIDRARS